MASSPVASSLMQGLRRPGDSAAAEGRSHSGPPGRLPRRPPGAEHPRHATWPRSEPAATARSSAATPPRTSSASSESPPSKPEVLSPTNRRIEGIAIRRTRSIDPRDATVWRGIPTTTAARTLVDQAATLLADELARACHEAGIKHQTTPRHFEAVLARRPNSPGAARLRRVLTGETSVTLSALERRFLSLIDEVGLPRPIMNRHASTKRVDARWPDHHLTVELDSYRFHNSRHSWEQDRRRDREARARGDELWRFTYDDVFVDPGPMLQSLLRRLTV